MKLPNPKRPPARQFVRYWLHAEHLLVDHEKMSKSVGNFATLRELFSHGHKPSSVRFLLASVPYRRQLNFTPESLQGAASSVERLRNFAARLRAGKFPAGASPAMAERAAKAREDFDRGLADDLNTAQALAAIFDLVRDANIGDGPRRIPPGRRRARARCDGNVRRDFCGAAR